MISMPFHSTRVCLELAPRMKTEVVFPSEPVRLTLSPGTSRSTSATLRAARSSMSFFVMTVTEAGVDSTVSGKSDAVTMMVWLNCCCAVRKRRTAKRFTTTSLRSCESCVRNSRSPGFRVVLVAPPSHPLQVRRQKAEGRSFLTSDLCLLPSAF